MNKPHISHRCILLVLLSTAACGHNHVQLMFPVQSASAEYYECKKAQDAKPEARAPQCARATDIDPARENQGSTQHVDVPRCKNSDQYYKVTILNADTAEPTLLVRCGQVAVLLHDEDEP
jgi:hypothetical protein